MAKKLVQSSVDIEAAAEQADLYISDLCAPDRMTPAQAVDYLETVIERCKSAIEALREENPELRDR